MTKDEVLASKQYLSAIGHWPKIPARANPERWLNGFNAEDVDHAASLLESLVYFSMEQTTKLCTSLFHSLSSEVAAGLSTYAERKSVWSAFVADCLVTFPTGERPNPTDSGHTFARLARQELGIDEVRFMYPEEVLERLYRGERRPIVMVDDFAGSGDQFIKTWTRFYSMPDGSHTSFEEIAKISPVEAFYIPAVATAYAFTRIEAHCTLAHLRTAHLLADNYSAVHPDTVVFPDELQAGARDFVARCSTQASINPTMELGWHDLALAIAFEHSVPDATLPILWADTPTWNSLLRRS
ncbi:phosphoribosyltransferase-like protein [Nocardioides alkalitolerans]|uniref:phosphoribosyltransferase-like protein n=1 Tax=Nocardioides alkalitolerans TaxID=281714 RepID=UPI0012FCD811|nr:hypothetical protein [Nocardioides alkalitolerans]